MINASLLLDGFTMWSIFI